MGQRWLMTDGDVPCLDSAARDRSTWERPGCAGMASIRTQSLRFGSLVWFQGTEHACMESHGNIPFDSSTDYYDLITDLKGERQKKTRAKKKHVGLLVRNELHPSIQH